MKLLLFSGGIDSTAIAWIERPDRLLFIDYGQRPAPGERRAAEVISKAIGIRLETRQVSLQSFGTGTLVGKESAGPAPEFWPFRNQMLITLAAMIYATELPLEVLIGTVATDVVHPDGRANFLKAISRVLKVQGEYSVVAPAVHLSSHDLLRRAALPLDILGWTFSCHTGEWACGQCRGCLKHNETKLAFGAA